MSLAFERGTEWGKGVYENTWEENVWGMKRCRIPQMGANLLCWGIARRQAEWLQGRVVRDEVGEKDRARSGLHAKSCSPFFKPFSLMTLSPTLSTRKDISSWILYFAQLNNASGLCKRGSDAVSAQLFSFPSSYLRLWKGMNKGKSECSNSLQPLYWDQWSSWFHFLRHL